MSAVINPKYFIQKKNILERQKDRLLARESQEVNLVHD